MTTQVLPNEQHFLLEDVDWRFYEMLLGQVGDRHVFITYDLGRLELMSPSWRHDTRSRLLGLLVTLVADALNVPIKGGGSTTFRRENSEAGLEPDQCFYIRNIDRISGKDEIDLSQDPPPDLAIEVEISRRLLQRQGIYERLGVPELWRDDGRRIRVYLLGRDGKYRQSARSLSFPSLPVNKLGDLMEMSRTLDDTAWVRAVRDWATKNLKRG